MGTSDGAPRAVECGACGLGVRLKVLSGCSSIHTPTEVDHLWIEPCHFAVGNNWILEIVLSGLVSEMSLA